MVRPDGLGTRVSLLYAANTAGAIVGTLGAGYSLVPYLGLNRSSLLAGGSREWVETGWCDTDR
jgi:spermidine synthase